MVHFPGILQPNNKVLKINKFKNYKGSFVCYANVANLHSKIILKGLDIKAKVQKIYPPSSTLDFSGNDMSAWPIIRFRYNNSKIPKLFEKIHFKFIYSVPSF